MVATTQLAAPARSVEARLAVLLPGCSGRDPPPARAAPARPARLVLDCYRPSELRGGSCQHLWPLVVSGCVLSLSFICSFSPHMASSSSSPVRNLLYSPSGVPIFEGDAYDFWHVQMRTLFLSQGLWDLIQVGFSKPTAENPSSSWDVSQLKEYSENLKRDAKALLYIQQGIGRSIFPRIMGALTAKEAREILKNDFQGSSKVVSFKLQNLWQEFDTLSMKESDDTYSYFTRITSLTNKIKSFGDCVEEKKVILKILKTLTHKYAVVVTVTEEAKDVNTLTINDLMGSLQAHEERMKRFEPQNLEQAFQSKVVLHQDKHNYEIDKRSENFRPNQRPVLFCNLCRRNNHDTFDCFYKCKRCAKPTHFAKDCPHRQRPNPQHNEEAKFSEQEGDEDFVFYSCDSAGTTMSDVWYLDSGCSNHMTNNKDAFILLDETSKSQVILGDGTTKEIYGKGTIAIKSKSGNLKYVPEVQFVPDLAQNLLSVGQLIKRGYKLIFDNPYCTIIDKTTSQVIARIAMSPNKVFPVSLPYQERNMFVGNNAKTVKWHNRYGHLNISDLTKLQRKHLVYGLPKLHDGVNVCHECALCKIHKLPHPQSSSRRTSRPLELVHADVWGSSRTSSLSGKNYFLLLVDDFTRMMWVYLLENKSNVFSKFKNFKALAENEANTKIKTLRTDRGGEFLSNAFTSFCQDHGIKRELTVRGTPEQNGVAERRNRTIIEMARCMMLESKLPKKFWAEAVNTACYILNRSPCRALVNTTPFEAWSKIKPDISHLRIFGSLTYSLDTTQSKDKLEEKGVMGILLGYSDSSKAYRIYNPST
ncbi:hypothetical protein KSP39_PZI024172 [Platanthera zijinensis]|uniref:Retrovirus-related Pol polyprotein from transposon TNT 1-94 n=1 Tax=Platanthera zijinensis TaxID=2320716 RepID=A0AAP0AS49_9ASPA